MQKFHLTLERVAEIRQLLDGNADDQLRLDTLEGETDAFEWVDHFLGRVAEERGFQAAVKERLANLSARMRSSEAREEGFRNALLVVLEAAGEKSVRRPEGTISLKAKPPGLAAVDESALPDEFFRVKREPDKAAIRDALAAGREVPGAVLGNGGVTLSIRYA